MQQALLRGERIKLNHVGTFADGVAVPQVGKIPFEICREMLDEVILVTPEQICSAIKRIYYETRVMMEPAGAVSLAGALKYLKGKGLKGKRTVTVNCGANMNFDVLRYVAQNSKVGEGKEILLAVDLPEKPGSLSRLCDEVVRGKQMTEFNYRYGDGETGRVFVGIETEREEEHEEILDALSRIGYPFTDLTSDELSKNHVRNMIGGKTKNGVRERVFTVVFPERPNALYDFLKAMHMTWNISLCHYENNGSSYSKVFLGIQVPEGEDAEMVDFLENGGYDFQEQTHNESYRLFLG